MYMVGYHYLSSCLSSIYPQGIFEHQLETTQPAKPKADA